MATLGFENLVKDLFIKSLYRWTTVVGLMGVYALVAVWLTQDLYPLRMYVPDWVYPPARLGAFLVSAMLLLTIFHKHARVTRREHLERLRTAPSEWDQLAPSLGRGEPRALAVVQDTLARDVTLWGLTGWIALTGVTLFILSGLILDLTVYMGMAGTALVLVRPSMPRLNAVLQSYRALEAEMDGRAG